MTEKIFFVCNPAADTGKLRKKWPPVLELLTDRLPAESFDWTFTEFPKHAFEICHDAINRGFDTIISVGGDGTANEVANSIIQYGKSIRFGMLPLGTSNDTHNNYGHPQEIDESLELILSGETRKYALGKVEGDFDTQPYYFIDHIDCGLAALAAQSARDGSRWIRGEFKYTYYSLKHILRFRRNKARVIIDGEEQNGEYALISASMGESMGGYKVWPGNNHDFDDFAFTIAEGQSRWELLKVMLAAEKGDHIEKQGIEYRRGKELKIYLDRPWPFQAEGEIFTESSTELRISYEPNAIELLTYGY